jgi:NAD-dependent DNA ligase (contains BRCT domain type II)
MSQEIRHRIVDLCEQIRDHQFKYYAQDKPTITDAEFDALLIELKNLKLRTLNSNCQIRQVI